MEAGLDISEACWEWITDHCISDPPYKYNQFIKGFKIWIKCFEPIKPADYLDNPYIIKIRSLRVEKGEGIDPNQTYYVYYIWFEDNVNYYEGASLFFPEGNNIVIIDYWYIYDETVPDIYHG